MEAASVAQPGAHAEHPHPPAAHRSSRVEPQLLGMLLFIISEVMVFGAFFTAYFFIRVSAGDPWPAPGMELPVAVAGVNTAILWSSSFTMHWAQESIKKGNRFGLKAGILTTVLNPLRSEYEAFRFLLYAMVVRAVVVRLVLLARAVL